MKQEHLVIIAQKDGRFARYMRRFDSIYKKHAESANYAYFTYIGELSPTDKVFEILDIFNFKEFSLDKETNYYRFKVHVE